MTEYVVQMAKVFHGFRLDNAHSTPKHLLRYLLQKARSLKPDLYVFGELFTNSRESDTQYCRELGINSLIRETLFVFIYIYIYIRNKTQKKWETTSMRWAALPNFQ